MASIRDFPDDDALWAIKWVDGFTSPHGGTRSPAVSVLLERLPVRNLSALSRLGKSDVAALLARPQRDSDAREFHVVRVLTGLLPHLVIGRVFQHKEYIGEIPASLSRITLPQAEQSGREVSVEKALPPPRSWDARYPYKLLLASEYHGIQNRFGSSRCFAYTNPKDRVEYVIPRSVILRTFYAPERELALAFTTGSWRTTRSNVICEKDLESGLRTCVDELGRWNVILGTHVTKEFGPLVGLLLFDDYAKTCAESIYSNALVDRNRSASGVWYASANLPFRQSTRGLRLNVKGYYLNPRVTHDRTEVIQRTFLVTSILACTWPDYLPDTVIWEKENSGEQGDETKREKGERPYARFPGSRIAESGIEITNEVDADASGWTQTIHEDTYSWLEGPELEKAQKSHSKQYEGGPGKTEEEETSTGSGGAKSHQSDSASPVASQTVVREPVNRFLHLIRAVNKCVEDGEVSSFSVLQPGDPAQRIHCNGLICWNFLSEKDRKHGRWPRTGWTVMPRTHKGERRRPRAALVLRLTIGEVSGLWIEIETTRSQKGTRSPFLLAPPSDDQNAASQAIQTIADVKGANLQAALLKAGLLPNGCRMRCYTHVYESRSGSELSAESVSRFLSRCKRDHERLGLG